MLRSIFEAGSRAGLAARRVVLAVGIVAVVLALPAAWPRDATGQAAATGGIGQEQALHAAGVRGRPARHLDRAAPTPTPTPPPELGVVETTNLVFTNLLPLVGDSLPSVETAVATALSSGIDPLLAGLAAEDPDTRHTIPGGIALDFGAGTEEPLGTLAGGITATYSDFVSSDSTLSFNGALATSNLTVNGLAYPITQGTTAVTATQRPGDGTVTMDITLSGTGPGGASTSGTIKVDTAKCKKYPIGGTITTSKGAYSATLRFNENCNGTFGFSLVGGRQWRFDPQFLNCYYGYWYNWGALWLVSEGSRLAIDNSDEDPVNMTLSGTATDDTVHIDYSRTCRTPSCDNRSHVYGTFDGTFWKEETDQWGWYRYRYYIGTLNSTYVRYNEDGTVYCQETHVLGEQDGIDGRYEFYELVR